MYWVKEDKVLQRTKKTSSYLKPLDWNKLFILVFLLDRRFSRHFTDKLQRLKYRGKETRLLTYFKTPLESFTLRSR